MNIAILCRNNCAVASKTMDYFSDKGRPIDLIIIERAMRKSLSQNERLYQETHRAFYRHLYPGHARKIILNSVLRFIPDGIQSHLKRLRDGLSPINIKAKAKARHIPFEEVEVHSSPATRTLLEKHDIGFALLTSSAWLIKEPLLGMNRLRIVNAHCAKLPEHRSLDSLPWSIMEGDKTGLTTHFVDCGIDTGPVLLFTEVKPEQGDNLVTLRQKIEDRKPEAFFETLDALHGDKLAPVPQLESEGTHHRPMTLAEMIEAERLLQERLRNL